MSEKLLEVNNLHKYFRVGRKKYVKAVDGVTFSIEKGKTLGLVGESGCGKSTLGRTIINIYEPTEGEVIYRNEKVTNLKTKKQRQENSRRMQMIFQDPYACLNPRMTVGDIISEGWDIRKQYNDSDKREKIINLLKTVGLNEEHANRFPHEFSGGQRQRIGIARALSMEAELIICDEPISALDVSIQAQIMNLLIKLQEERELTYLFIAHDLSMVRYISDDIAVMYLGEIVEQSDSDTIYKEPLHPYTKALFSAIPIPNPAEERKRKQIMLKGDVPSPINGPVGCKFAGRCNEAKDICFKERPELREVTNNHKVACHLI